MKTTFMLMAQHDGMPVIPVETVAKDHFGLDTRNFLRKVADGEILLPLIQMERSQKSARGVHVGDLADFIDQKRADARRDMEKVFA